MLKTRSARFLALIFGITAGALLFGGSAPAVTRLTPGICGAKASAAPPQVYAHVIWVFMENQSYAQVIGPAGSPARARSPFLNSLADSCGVAANYHSVAHPSLPNYIAATSPARIHLNCTPTTCPIAGVNLFEEVQNTGAQWRSYVESMPTNCATRDAGRYSTLFNPAVYYTSVTSECRRWDVPLGATTQGALFDAITNDAFPAFSLIIPDRCDNTHDCPVSVGDAWLEHWVTQIANTASFKSGSTVLLITWDEGEDGRYTEGEDCVADPLDESCHVATIVVSPFVVPGTISYAFAGHAELLGATEYLLGLSRTTASEDSAPSLVSAFHLDGSTAVHGNWTVVATLPRPQARTLSDAALLAPILRDYDLESEVIHVKKGYQLIVGGLYTQAQAQATAKMLSATFPHARVGSR